LLRSIYTVRYLAGGWGEGFCLTTLGGTANPEQEGRVPITPKRKVKRCLSMRLKPWPQHHPGWPEDDKDADNAEGHQPTRPHQHAKRL
jgi:hypothetical protein